MNTIKKDLLTLFEKVFRVSLNENEYGEEIRKMNSCSPFKNSCLDSIDYIRFLAEIEDYFKIDFGYETLDNMKVVSINSLSEYIEMQKR